MLTLIFDKNANERYAPDLVFAIELWKAIYIDENKMDSHNSKANRWIRNNTPYKGGQDDNSTRRLREVTSPYNDWHAPRKKYLKLSD